MVTLEEVEEMLKNKYRDYNEIIECKNKLFQMEYEKQTSLQKNINIVNELSMEYKKYIQAQENISATNMREQIESNLNSLNNEFQEASEFFKSIAVTSDNIPIDLSRQIFGDDENKLSDIDIIFTDISKAKSDIALKIEELEKEISKINSEIDGLKQNLKDICNKISECEYYEKKLVNEIQILKSAKRKLNLGGEVNWLL